MSAPVTFERSVEVVYDGLDYPRSDLVFKVAGPGGQLWYTIDVVLNCGPISGSLGYTNKAGEYEDHLHYPIQMACEKAFNEGGPEALYAVMEAYYIDHIYLFTDDEDDTP
jgi:hypothetical protein